MVLTTMISRIPDGLPLATSMQDDEQARRKLIEYQKQAILLLKKINFQSPKQCTVESVPYYFHYLIEGDVCFLVLCEKNFSKLSAFSFLEDIAAEFYKLYGRQASTVSRPYALIEFDNYIQKAKKKYVDFRVRRNLNTLNKELQDVQRIMVENIDDVLKRGTVLSELDTKAKHLSKLSKKYKKEATNLNLTSMYIILTAAAVFVIFYFYILCFINNY